MWLSQNLFPLLLVDLCFSRVFGMHHICLLLLDITRAILLIGKVKLSIGNDWAIIQHVWKDQCEINSLISVTYRYYDSRFYLLRMCLSWVLNLSTTLGRAINRKGMGDPFIFQGFQEHKD